MEDADPQGSLPWGGTAASVNIMANPLIPSIDIEASYPALPKQARLAPGSESHPLRAKGTTYETFSSEGSHRKVLQEGKI